MATEARLTLDGTHTVLTPEYVEFNFVLAGLMSRFLAWLLDTLITTLVTVVVSIALALTAVVAKGFAGAAMFILWFLIDWGYGILLEAAMSGQTIGKRALGLRVIHESGVRAGFYHVVIRNLARPVDRLPIFYLVGGVAALFSQDQQRLGDMLAGTIVVRERRLKIPASLGTATADRALVESAEFTARVARISADEEQLILSAALRREELGMDARLKVFAALARRLEEEWGFVKPEHLSDEKLVLLVMAGLAAKSARRRPTKKPAAVRST